MVIAAEPGGLRKFVLRCDRSLPPEEQTVWVFKLLSERQFQQAQDLFSVENGEQRDVASIALFLLHHWENFKREDGSSPEFTADSLRCLSALHLAELCEFGFEINGMSEAIRKNLQLGQSSPAELTSPTA